MLFGPNFWRKKPPLDRIFGFGFLKKRPPLEGVFWRKKSPPLQVAFELNFHRVRNSGGENVRRLLKPIYCDEFHNENFVDFGLLIYARFLIKKTCTWGRQLLWQKSPAISNNPIEDMPFINFSNFKILPLRQIFQIN